MLKQVSIIELDRVAGALGGQLARIESDLVEFTVGLLDRSDWRGTGIRSAEHWLEINVGISPARAADLVRVATRAAELITPLRKLKEGRLVLDQVAVIAKHVPERSTGKAAILAEYSTVTQLRRAVQGYPFSDPPPGQGTEAEDKAKERANAKTPASLQFGIQDGRFRLRYETDAAEGALVEQALREAKDALFTGGDTKATLADAMAEIANRSLTGVSGPRRANYKVMVHLDTSGHGWLGKKGALPQHLVEKLTCNGEVTPVWETDGAPVNVGRSMRIVPTRTRRLIEDRDGGCVYPGCPITGFLEVHHLVHWSKGGTTDADSMVCLCPRHHTEHHQGRFTITGTPTVPGGLRFHGPAGHAIGPFPKRDLPPPPEPAPYDWRKRSGPRDESLIMRNVNLEPPIGEPPPYADPNSDAVQDLWPTLTPAELELTRRRAAASRGIGPSDTATRAAPRNPQPSAPLESVSGGSPPRTG